MIVGYFDGCVEPVNPGGTIGFGAWIERDGESIWETAQMLPANPANSNNVAEYLGFIALLDRLSDEGLRNEPIEIRGHSQLVINQMFGTWHINDGLYADVARIAAEKLRPHTTGRHVKRHLNEKPTSYLNNNSLPLALRLLSGDLGGWSLCLRATS
jgi:ribonuclease HI